MDEEAQRTLDVSSDKEAKGSGWNHSPSARTFLEPLFLRVYITLSNVHDYDTNLFIIGVVQTKEKLLYQC